ncbi:MAG: ATP-binding protein [Hyphomonadaceae bacterium]
MSKNAVPQRANPAPSTGHRSVLALVALLLVAFAVALVVQAEMRRRAVTGLAIDAQTATAIVLAERVNAGLAQAWGAAGAAAEMARRTNAFALDPQSVAAAAARARAVRGAAVYDSSGRLLAITDRSLAPLAEAAVREAAGDPDWAGAPAIENAPNAPVIVRRVAGGRIVSVLNPEALLPDARAAERALIASESGAILHASSLLQQEGLQQQRLLLAAAPAGDQAGGAVKDDARGRAFAVGAARTAIGGLRVVAAAPTASTLSVLFSTIAQFVLLAAAPLAAVGALLLLLNQNQRRVKLAEAEVERAEAHFRLAADSARAGVFEWRSDEDILQLSEQAARMLHAQLDTLPLSKFVALAAPDDRPSVEEELSRARRTGALDLRFRIAAGGAVAWIEARGVAIEDGQSAPRFIGSVLDVTPRHEAELRVTRLERQLRAAIDSYSGPFALWDARKRLMLWNTAYAAAFQLGPDLLRPRASYEAVAMAAAAQVRRERVHPVDPQIREIELVSGEWLQLVERRTGDGGIVTVGADITPLKRQEEALKRNDKRLRELVSRLENSEQQIKKLAREAEEARLRAEEANTAKSAFLANMSHELRTPLTHIIGFSEIMAKELFGPIQNEQYKQYSSDIYGSGNHLLDLINDILDMAKIEAGKMQMAPRPLDPMEAIEQAVRLTRRKADEKNLQIIIDAEGLPEIEADHRAVKQMLINLLSNAIKFTDEGAIMLRGRTLPEGIVLRVVDTGRGIPADQLPRLARPFEQVETELSRNHSGTGLGLALTKSLAEMHGGRLTIESEVGRGTVVSIFLPRAFGGNAEAADYPTAAE